MTKIGILYFSTCSQTENIRNATNAKMIALPCTLDGVTYKTGDISLHDYMDLCMEKKMYPKTSQPSTGEIIEAIKLLRQNYETIFVICPKHDLTGVYNNSKLAVSMLYDSSNIYVVDTFSMAMGEAIAIEEILKLQNNFSISEIFEKLDTLLKTYTTYAFPGNLQFLKMSGRVTAVSAVVGGILNMKSAVKVTQTNEKAELDHKGRGYKSIFKYIEGQIDSLQPDSACISDLYCDEDIFKHVIELLKDKGLKVTITEEVDIVPATHFGPQSFGLVLFKENK